jgi:hypothetical protein
MELVSLERSVNLICENFPKFVFRFDKFLGLYPFTLAPANLWNTQHDFTLAVSMYSSISQTMFVGT